LNAAVLRVRGGELTIRRLSLPWPDAGLVTATLGRRRLPCDRRGGVFDFGEDVNIPQCAALWLKQYNRRLD